MGRSKIVYGGETLIDLTNDSVTPETLLKGATAHNKAGEKITGTKELKTQAKTVQSSRVAQTVKPDSGCDGLSEVTVNAFRHSRIIKTMGSSDVDSYSIPISEIGFEPRIWAVTIYNNDSSTIANTSISKNWLLAGICDMHTFETEATSTSGVGISTGKKLISFGTSKVGAVNGSNFTFTGDYVYFAKSHTYRFFFWG